MFKLKKIAKVFVPIQLISSFVIVGKSLYSPLSSSSNIVEYDMLIPAWMVKLNDIQLIVILKWNIYLIIITYVEDEKMGFCTN